MSFVDTPVISNKEYTSDWDYDEESRILLDVTPENSEVKEILQFAYLPEWDFGLTVHRLLCLVNGNELDTIAESDDGSFEERYLPYLELVKDVTGGIADIENTLIENTSAKMFSTRTVSSAFREALLEIAGRLDDLSLLEDPKNWRKFVNAIIAN